jgi:hypothetical protein
VGGMMVSDPYLRDLLKQVQKHVGVSFPAIEE